MGEYLQFNAIRNIRTNRILSLSCLLIIGLYLGVALPTHHHRDGAEHNDCPVCVASHQPSVVEPVASAPTPFIECIELSGFCAHVAPTFCSAVYHTRAPPILSSSIA
jgi:hypothetical protein